METSYCKSGDEYEVKLCVRRIVIEHVGNSSYPFACDIATQDDKFFRCAVSFDDIAQFVLAKENDILKLKLEVVFEKSQVMGVIECKNLTQQWTDVGQQGMRHNKCSYFEAEVCVENIFFLSFPEERSLYPQRVYYCILSQADGTFVCFYINHDFMPALLGAQKGDDISLKVGNWFYWGGVDVLQVFENKSRMIKTINQAVHEL